MSYQLLQGSARALPLADESVQMCVTSPPYWGLRQYAGEQREWWGEWYGALGLEPTPELFVEHMVAVFREVKRVLRRDGTCWINLGDSYAGGGKGGNPAESQYRKQATNFGSLIAPTPVPPGLKAKDLVGIPWMVAFALRADGWYLRSDIVWAKPNPMPESVTDRPTKAHEYLFLLAKSERYYYDADAIREPHTAGHIQQQLAPVKDRGEQKQYGKQGLHDFLNPLGRNKRTVWNIATRPYPGAHFATYPEELVEPCILAGAPKGGVVLDPFNGSGTTGAVALRLGRSYVGVDISREYLTEQALHRVDPLAGQAHDTRTTGLGQAVMAL